MSFRNAIEQSWIKPNLLTLLLWPLSQLYRFLFSVRSRLYSIGVLNCYQASVPVVVVGNLTVGGTGKTPLVLFLIDELRKLGYTPGVISRGYGGNAASYPLVVTTDSKACESGDEPALIVRRTGVPMVVGPNRKAAVERLLQLNDVDIVISDDGLQHLALNHDIEICLLDSTSPQKNYNLLPAGPYREDFSRLESVDLVLVHGAQEDAKDKFAMNLIASAPQRVNPYAKRRVNTNENGQCSAGFDADRGFHAVAGIGNPQRFFDTCKSLGYRFSQHAFPDHHAFSIKDINFAGETVLMTEKDAVKCQDFAESNHWYLPVNATISEQFSVAFKAKLTQLK